MTDDSQNRKLSVFKLKEAGRKSVVTIDSKFEFNAPKYFDFTKISNQQNEEKIKNEDYIDPWFFIEHRSDPITLDKKRQSENPNKNNKSNKDAFKRSSSSVINKNSNTNINNNVTSLTNMSSLSSTNFSCTTESSNIDEKIKLLNENVKKRKYSQFEKEIKTDVEESIKETSKNNQTFNNNTSFTNIHHTKKKKTAHSTRHIEVRNLKPLINKQVPLPLPMNNFNSNVNKSVKKENNPNIPNFSRETKNNNFSSTSNLNIPRVNKFDLGSGTGTSYNSNSNNTHKNSSLRNGSNSVNASNSYKRAISTHVDKEIKSNINRDNTRKFNFINDSSTGTSIKLTKNNTNLINPVSNNNFYQNNLSLGNLNNNKSKSVNSSSLRYCPRIHSANLMKKWEGLKGVKWYELSPSSRHEANQEISEMIKNKEI